MNIQQIYSNLCVYDSRNPAFDLFDYDSEDRKPRSDCYCDNCFYGRDDLALEILGLHEIINSSNKCFNIPK